MCLAFAISWFLCCSNSRFVFSNSSVVYDSIHHIWVIWVNEIPWASLSPLAAARQIRYMALLTSGYVSVSLPIAFYLRYFGIVELLSAVQGYHRWCCIHGGRVVCLPWDRIPLRWVLFISCKCLWSIASLSFKPSPGFQNKDPMLQVCIGPWMCHLDFRVSEDIGAHCDSCMIH